MGDISWGGHFDQVSKKLDKSCGFFIVSLFLGHMLVFLSTHAVIQ